MAVVQSAGGDSRPEASGELVVPDNVAADGSIVMGSADAPVSVAVYFDYLCPFCGRFEDANSDELARLVDEGTARVELRALSFLDAQSRGAQYSTRAANALATVADAAPEQVWDFHQGLFAQQPKEGTTGLSDDEIAEIASKAGVPAAVASSFQDRTFEPWVADVTKKAFASGLSGTPTVLVDGVVFTGDLYTSGPLTKAVEAAAASE